MLTLSSDPAPAEGGGAVTVTATLDEPAPADGTTVTLTAGGTATLDTDYTLSSSTIAIAESETAGTATITVIDDAEDDDGETIVLEAESVNPTLAAATLTLTIGDNDGAISYTLSASPQTVVEGGEVTITATASRVVAANTEVVAARDPASTAGDEDFSLRPRLITIMEGDTEGAVTLTATDDDDVEDDESLTLNGMVGDTAAGSVTLTIEDDDAALPAALTLTADPAPAEGGAEVTVTAALDGLAPADGTTVTLTTGGTAMLDTDYTLSSTTITIAAGETAGTATITVIDDAEIDAGETIVLDATSANPTLTAPPPTLIIEDNDVPVPALPVGGALLLGALLLWRGAVRARGRAGGQA